jgi:lysophospholipase
LKKPFITRFRCRAPLVQGYDDNPDAKLGGLSKKWAVEACGAAATARKNAGQIAVPVLLVSAGADTVVTATGHKEFCDTLKRAHADRRPHTDLCTLVTINGGAHELFVESDEYRVPALTTILQVFGPP